DESRLVILAEGKDKPRMPPEKSKQPRPEEVAVLRAWVAAGAKEDLIAAVKLPPIKPHAPLAPPVAAVAYRPDGKLLAASGHREVVLIDVASGDVAGKFPGPNGEVTAITFSRDGKLLAVASGTAGTLGEVRVYAVANGMPAEKPLHVLAAHKDLVLDLAWSPD